MYWFTAIEWVSVTPAWQEESIIFSIPGSEIKGMFSDKSISVQTLMRQHTKHYIKRNNNSRFGALIVNKILSFYVIGAAAGLQYKNALVW